MLENKKIGENVKKLRKLHNITQQELANKINLGRDAIINIEKGTRKINLEEITKMSQIFNTSINNILNYKEQDVNKEIINIKGIILAGGYGTRLYPITESMSKQLIQVYDKPMIYYPLYILMLAGINDILIITTKEDQKNFINLLGDGSKFGIKLSYIIQPSPDGLAQAFILGEKFISNNPCAMILGDNIFYGGDLYDYLIQAKQNVINGKATVFGCQVKDPERFGIMEIDSNNNIISVEEKPKKPKSNFAITGLYFYPKGVSKKAKTLKPSARGELEITDLNNEYLKEGLLKACLLREGNNWIDTGTFDSLLDASNMVRTIEKNKDKIICCPEEIAYKNNWMNSSTLRKRAQLLNGNSYGIFLKKLIKEEDVNENN